MYGQWTPRFSAINGGDSPIAFQYERCRWQFGRFGHSIRNLNLAMNLSISNLWTRWTHSCTSHSQLSKNVGSLSIKTTTQLTNSVWLTAYWRPLIKRWHFLLIAKNHLKIKDALYFLIRKKKILFVGKMNINMERTFQLHWMLHPSNWRNEKNQQNLREPKKHKHLYQ